MTVGRVRVGIETTRTVIEKDHQRLVDLLGTGPLDLGAFDPGAYPASAREHATEFWLKRMEAEHRSVPVFTQLALQLIEANAPIDTKSVMLRMAQDEIRHTEICGQVVTALGGEACVEADVTVIPLATHRGCSVEERALRNVLYASTSEMIAVGRLVDSLESATDPLARAAIRAVLADEVMHGRFGFAYLEAAMPWLDEQPDVRASLEEYLTHAFAVLEAESPTRAWREPGARSRGPSR